MKDKRNIIAARKEIESVIEKFNNELPKGIQLEQAFDQEIGVKTDSPVWAEIFDCYIFGIADIASIGYKSFFHRHDLHSTFVKYWFICTGCPGIHS